MLLHAAPSPWDALQAGGSANARDDRSTAQELKKTALMFRVSGKARRTSAPKRQQ